MQKDKSLGQQLSAPAVLLRSFSAANQYEIIVIILARILVLIFAADPVTCA
jgi:uncharacterized integral membrane protein